MLNFVTPEIHVGCSLLFSSDIPENVKDIIKEKFYRRLDCLDATLTGKEYLLGEFGVADAYLYTVLSWLPHFSIDIKRWKALARFMDRIGARATVRAARAAEAATPFV